MVTAFSLEKRTEPGLQTLWLLFYFVGSERLKRRPRKRVVNYLPTSLAFGWLRWRKAH